MPAARAAASREPPSSARASIRRAARASRHRAASRRSSPPPSSRRVIATTIGPLPTGPYRRINRRGPRDAPGTRPVRNNGRWYYLVGLSTGTALALDDVATRGPRNIARLARRGLARAPAELGQDLGLPELVVGPALHQHVLRGRTLSRRRSGQARERSAAPTPRSRPSPGASTRSGRVRSACRS